jgi:signal transduction histidine kinase
MITNLLDLSRIESGTQRVDRVPWRLFELVEKVIRQFDPISKRKGVTLNLVCPDTTLQILADHDKFVQIITNLVDNAIKFTPAGGEVTVSLARSDPDCVLLTVADTGQGIPSDALGNLFKPFYQAQQVSGTHARGLGLGLSIVKSLVEIHEGTISVTSELEHGSEFRIRLPLFVHAS